MKISLSCFVPAVWCPVVSSYVGPIPRLPQTAKHQKCGRERNTDSEHTVGGGRAFIRGVRERKATSLSRRRRCEILCGMANYICINCCNLPHHKTLQVVSRSSTCSILRLPRCSVWDRLWWMNVLLPMRSSASPCLCISPRVCLTNLRHVHQSLQPFGTVCFLGPHVFVPIYFGDRVPPIKARRAELFFSICRGMHLFMCVQLSNYHQPGSHRRVLFSHRPPAVLHFRLPSPVPCIPRQQPSQIKFISMNCHSSPLFCGMKRDEAARRDRQPIGGFPPARPRFTCCHRAETTCVAGNTPMRAKRRGTSVAVVRYR